MPQTDEWLRQFHAGHRGTLADCYRDYFEVVDRTVGSILFGADKENVVHDVFCSLVADAQTRRGFTGGSLAGWLRTVSRNRAIDYYRQRRRRYAAALDDVNVPADSAALPDEATVAEQQARLARDVIARFQEQFIPERWRSFFERRFLRQLSQRETARELGIPRTTLAYQERQIRRALKRFLASLEGLNP